MAAPRLVGNMIRFQSIAAVALAAPRCTPLPGGRLGADCGESEYARNRRREQASLHVNLAVVIVEGGDATK